MLFTISGKHIEITDGIRQHVEDKIEKLPRYFNSINQVEVVIEGNEGGKPAVEIIVRGEHNVVFVAKESGEDLYACIDIASHKIERQLTKKKGKQRNNKHIMNGLEEISEPEDAGDIEDIYEEPNEDVA